MKKNENLRKSFVSLMFLCCILASPFLVAQTFEHPGVFNREGDFARMRQKIAEKAEPWYTTWNNLLASPEAQLSWSPRATATVIRGGTGDNISLMYRDVAAAYQHALIYKISGDVAHGNKAVEILNAWANINTLLSGNADRYLASGLDGYQFANAAEMMRGYPGFDLEKFKNYMLNVFFYPMNERFLIGNAWGAPHNDACATNYRVNWDAANMAAMAAISVLCDNKTGFDEVINYCKSGDGTGNITRAVNFLYPNYGTTGANLIGQWEESGRDQGHATGGMGLYGIFCEIAWNQGVDLYGYDNYRYRKGAEYVARYNLGDSVSGVWKYNDLPYTTYTRLMGSTCTSYTESALSSSVRGKLGACWEMIYNHYARRLNQGDKVTGLNDILQQQQYWSRSWPTLSVHADTYDTPGGGGLTFATDSGSYILPWLNMDIMPRSIVKIYYGSTTLKDSVLTVKASGDGIKGTLDHYQYVYRRLIDDGSIVTRIDSLNEVNAVCQAGLMMRENLEQNSANVFLSLSAAKGLVFSSRDSTGLGTTTIASDNTIKSFPYWLKLSRSGNVITASTSVDGSNWIVSATKTINFNRSVYVGAAVSSDNKTQFCTAVFSKTKFVQGNMKPIVKITAPTSNLSTLIAPANTTIKGTAYDPDGLLSKAEVYVNGAMVYSTTVSPISYNLSGLNEGSYAVYIKAYDRLGAIQISDTTVLTVSTATSKIPWYKFDETKPGYFSVDASGNGLTATLYNGTLFTTGKINNSVKLDGVDDYVKLPSSFIHKLSDFTVSTWVKIDTLRTWSRIFDFGQGTENYMMLTPSNGTGMTFSMNTTAGSMSVTASRTLPVGTWNFVTVTLTNNTLIIYLNGIQIGKSLSFRLRPYDIGASTYSYIGKSLFSADPYLKGQVDDFRFFNYALSAAEINAIMNPTAVNEIKANPEMFYPNPATNEIHLVNAENFELSIYDTMGKLTLRQKINSSDEPVDISRLTQGVYIVKTTDQNFNQQQNRLIVK